MRKATTLIGLLVFCCLSVCKAQTCTTILTCLNNGKFSTLDCSCACFKK